MKEHPFPPIVRWAIFPALAAIAGTAGGAPLAYGIDNRSALLTGGLSAGAALAFALTRRVWVSLLLAPGFGLVAVSTAAALIANRNLGVAPDPWRVFLELLARPEFAALFGLAALAQTAGTWITIRQPWGVSLGVWILAAFLTLIQASLVIRESEPRVAAFLTLATLVQILPVRASVALARRLRPAEAA